MKENFARHDAGTCRWCDVGRPDFCAILSLFVESGGGRGEWNVLRHKCIPTAASALNGLHGMTVWKAVCRSDGITDFRGGKYRDGGEEPTVDAVVSALLYAEVSR